ncbi:MAG: hypothetical protein KDD62_10160 [Bdellovibrionales bacterium]|nr:hypothetical protein [Bdellovibrionales bacterium]
MALTRIDCSFFRGKEAKKDTCSFVAFNPRKKPGSLVVAGSQAIRMGLSSQVACKLALEHFVAAILDSIESKDFDNGDAEEMGQALLEHSFRSANASVYEFGHQLAAGGRMAASVIGFVLEHDLASAGRVGPWTTYLWRDGELFPFFERNEIAGATTGEDGFLGSQSVVTVETASVPIESGDYLFVFSEKLSYGQEELLKELTAAAQVTKDFVTDIVFKKVFANQPALGLALCAQIGPDAIYLSEAV